MKHAVLDTNVMVSAAIKPGSRAGRVLAHLRDGAFSLLYSREILSEK
jgi:predicted nucleic acid-binding protein